MISINDLVRARFQAPDLDPIEADPLREVDALQETQLLDSRVCHLTSTAALLFELRTALQFDSGNAALLVVRDLNFFEWKSSAAPGPLVSWTVVSNSPGRRNGGFCVQLGFFPDAQLELAGDLAEFYVLEVDGIGDVPPNYSDMDLGRVQEELPLWSSACRPLQASTSR
ncbi:hypothetical protein [Streptomyces sp. NPDC048350]|uniref:hypothetical protein n=1 Tax=Streptomyces sp. NPDC048350 TaxID=3365538 RepID=UPI003714EB50